MLELTISVPEYSPFGGLTFESWPELRIRVTQLEGETVILANAEGLIGLARRLLALAQDGIPDGFHLHLEDGVQLQTGSAGLVLERE